jgi:lipopolysaccharide/colanic/teichoic acid biosynthesis glycosyltransferase
VSHRHVSLSGWRGRAKRAFDVAAAAAALVALAPLMAIVAALVALTSRGPVLYRQRRLGLGGRPFEMLKFRTMDVGAEPDGRAVWATDIDPRCTRVGGPLRRYGLDELPQLWNVLRGDMSLVGPRPERPEFATEFASRWPRFPERLSVRGGITGLAQVEGLRGDTHVGERLEADLRYMSEWSLGRDLLILARTLPALVARRRRHDEQKPERAAA